MSYYDDDDDVDELFARAKAKYRQERSREKERIRRDEGYAYNWTQTVIGFLTAILNVFSAVWGSCCFITTALAGQAGFRRSFHALSVLRQFRDDYIIRGSDPSRIDDLYRYYEIAPRVVTAIHDHPCRDRIWKSIYVTVMRAVRCIERNEFEAAYELYKRQVIGLGEALLGDMIDE